MLNEQGVGYLETCLGRKLNNVEIEVLEKYESKETVEDKRKMVLSATLSLPKKLSHLMFSYHIYLQQNQ